MRTSKMGGLSIFLLLVIGIFTINFISAQTTTDLTFSTDSTVQIKQLTYNPFPVSPGEYFDFWISVQYVGNPGINGVRFELVPEYPFSLDPNQSAVQDFGTINSPSITLHYKLKVDKDAVAGTNELKLNYFVNGIEYTQTFDVDVENPRTNFDAVIQQISGSDVSIAIANTGLNAANSIIVKIPEQDSFTTSGTDGQMVGNLASGDYTIVGFTIIPKRNINPLTAGQTANSNGQNNYQNYQAQNTSLTFEIDYTDTIGERRTVDISLPLKLTDMNSSITGAVTGRNYGSRSSWSIWYTVLIILGVLGIATFISYKKFPKQTKNFFSKLNPKNLFRRKKEKIGHDHVPDWVKNSKDKEKNK